MKKKESILEEVTYYSNYFEDNFNYVTRFDTLKAMELYAKETALDFVAWKMKEYKDIDCFYSDDELWRLFEVAREQNLI